MSGCGVDWDLRLMWCMIGFVFEAVYDWIRDERGLVTSVGLDS